MTRLGFRFSPEWVAVLLTVLGAVFGGTWKLSAMSTKLDDLTDPQIGVQAQLRGISSRLDQLSSRRVSADRSRLHLPADSLSRAAITNSLQNRQEQP